MIQDARSHEIIIDKKCKFCVNSTPNLPQKVRKK
jgi:hypothetical protein